MDKPQTKDPNSLQTPGVLIKYQTAGNIAKIVMKELLSKAVVGADIRELCMYGNKRINEECNKVFNNKKYFKGIAFPVSISPNQICGHFCPLSEETRKI